MNIDKSIKRMLGTKKKSKVLNNFKFKKIGGRNDWDGDGVPNRRDCQPRNTMRQDEIKYIKVHGYMKNKFTNSDDVNFKYNGQIYDGLISGYNPQYGYQIKILNDNYKWVIIDGIPEKDIKHRSKNIAEFSKYVQNLPNLLKTEVYTIKNNIDKKYGNDFFNLSKSEQNNIIKREILELNLVSKYNIKLTQWYDIVGAYIYFGNQQLTNHINKYMNKAYHTQYERGLLQIARAPRL